MKVYFTTAQATDAHCNDDGSYNHTSEERTFSNLKKAYEYALGYVGKASGITPSYATMTRKMNTVGYHPIFGERFADDAEMPDYFLTHKCRVGIQVREVE